VKDFEKIVQTVFSAEKPLKETAEPLDEGLVRTPLFPKANDFFLRKSPHTRRPF